MANKMICSVHKCYCDWTDTEIVDISNWLDIYSTFSKSGYYKYRGFVYCKGLNNKPFKVHRNGAKYIFPGSGKSPKNNK